MKIRVWLIFLYLLTSGAYVFAATSEPYVDVVTYEYDGLNRLVRAQSGKGISQEFNHDHVSNRVSEIRRNAPVGAPVANSDMYSLSENQVLDVNIINGLLTNDTFDSNQTVSVNLITSPLSGSLLLAENGSFTYQPNLDYFGEDEFFYQVVSNETGLSSNTVRVNLVILPTNPQPIANEDFVITTEDSVVQIAVLSNDLNVTSIIAVDTPFNGSAQIQGGQIIYTPNPNYAGQDTFTYVAQGEEGIASARVIITVDPVNDPPQTPNIDSRIVFGDTVTYPIFASVTDPEEDELTLVSVTNSDGSVINGIEITGNEVSYTPANFVPIAPDNPVMFELFRYTIQDSVGNQSSGQIFNFTLRNIAPVAVVDCFNEFAAQGCVNNTEYEIQPSTPTVLDVLRNDFDTTGEAISISQITRNPNRGTAVILNDTVLYTPSDGQSGIDDNFEYEISDAFGNTSRANVFVFITGNDNADNAPIARDDCFDSSVSLGCGVSNDYFVGFGEDAVLNVLQNDTAPNDEPLEIVSVTSSNRGVQINQVGNTLIYSAPSDGPLNGFQDIFTYTIRDTVSGLTSQASVFLRIGARDNVAPVAVDDNFIVIRNRPKGLNLVSNDTDGNFDTLSIDAQSLSTPNLGTVSIISSGVARYVPFENVEGRDSFTYQVRDPDGALSGTATVIINIRELPLLLPILDLILLDEENTPTEGQ